jgi:Family of unknown function (DUF5519)
MSEKNPAVALHEALTAWDGVTTGPGRFGSIVYYFGKREIGHVHGNSHADIPLPTRIRNELVEAGRAEPHHFLPNSGWVSAPLGMGTGAVLDLFRINRDLIIQKKHRMSAAGEG